MRVSVLLAVLSLGCDASGESDDTVVPPDETRPDPCLAVGLAHLPLAVIRVDGVAVHDFRGGLNDPLTIELAGDIVERAGPTCPGGFAVRDELGVVTEVDLCIEGGPPLPDLSAGGSVVDVRLEVLSTNRGEFSVAVTDVDGVVAALNVDQEDVADLTPLQVSVGRDQVLCDDAEAVQTLVFAMDEVEVEVDSGSAGQLITADGSFEVRTLVALRKAPVLHLNDWAGALYSVWRDD